MNYYFIGIGGIGMSALARFFKQRGDSVCGYDHTPSPLTRSLEEEGIGVHYDDNPQQIPDNIDLCIYTPAVPKNTAVYQTVVKRGVKILKRSQMLGELTRGKRCIAVAGTHGKTTTTALIAHIFHSAGVAYQAFLGGISKNLGSNMHCDPAGEYVIVEADEYDRSFLQLHPHFAVITATDPDHLDIYGTHDNMLDAFEQFAHQVDGDGRTFINSGVSMLKRKADNKDYSQFSSAPVELYSGCDTSAAHHIEKLTTDKQGAIHFDYKSTHGDIDGIQLNHSALYNVENATAAIAVAQASGISAEQIRQGIATFAGVQRRFDYRVHNDKITYIDDYAHHPQEIAAAIGSVRQLFAGRRVAAIFQPHLYSRTADFYKEFAQALSMVDKVILLDIYPARELPMPGVTSKMILDNISIADKRLCSKQEAVELAATIDTDVLMTLGAGDIDRLVPQIEEKLNVEN